MICIALLMGMNDSISIDYIENESGTKLDRPVLNKLLNDANGAIHC